MRVILALLALLLLAAPAATAGIDPPSVGCDVDDDLYNHCHAGPVNWVTGPACVGVKLGETAECWDLRGLLA